VTTHSENARAPGSDEPANPLLDRRLISGATWSFLLQFVNRGTALARQVVLARILAPHDFGLFGIALLALATIEALTETGFSRALVQADDAERHLDTAWTVGVLRGLLLSAALFVLSPWVAGFFEEPAATWLIRAIAVVPLLHAIRNPGVLQFQRELDFKAHALYESGSILVNTVVAIIYALATSSVWALVLGLLAGGAVQVLLSFMVHDFRPRWSMEEASTRFLFRYGKWVLGSTIFIFLLNQGDDIFLAKVLGATALGYYQMAYLVISIPTTELTHVVSRVTFPAYRHVRGNVDRLRRAYLTVVQLTSLVALPLAVLIFVHAGAIVTYVFGETWLPMVPLIQIMAPWGFIRSLGSCAGPLFDGSGRPDITTKLTGIKLLTLAALIVPLTNTYGMEGTAAAVVLTALLNNPIADTAALRLVGGRWRDLFHALGRPVAFTTAALGASLPVLWWLGDGVLGTGASLLVFVMTYLPLLWRYGGEPVERLKAAAPVTWGRA
jgi:O-antigen/teichoic acid export membrane protein